MKQPPDRHHRREFVEADKIYNSKHWRDMKELRQQILL